MDRLISACCACVIAAMPALWVCPPVHAQDGPPAAPPAEAPAAEADYAARAGEVTAYIQSTYYSERRDYYRLRAGERGPADMWACGVLFPALVGAARHDPDTYRPVMDRFFASMDRYWDDDAPIPGYEPVPIRGDAVTADKYYDDNAWMAITFAEAYELTHDPRYLGRANAAQAFVLSGEDDVLGGGIWWHERRNDNTKNTCSCAPAAVACLLIARNDPAQRDAYVQKARELVAWTNRTLQDPEDGLFYDRIKADTGEVKRGKVTYNTALMIRANLGLYRATGEQRYLDEAVRVGDAAEAFISRRSGVYRNAYRFSHLLVEADLGLWRATGEQRFFDRAKLHADAFYAQWAQNKPAELIENAAIARTLWLMADTQDQDACAFWQRVEGGND